MGYLYIFTIVFLILGFIFFKKSDKKINLIKWICISSVSLYAYNITICMILGILHIKQEIWILSCINFIFGVLFWQRIIRKKECQKYKSSKFDIISIVVILTFFVVMFIKDLYIYKGDVTHYIVDSAIHYRAAKHYSDNLQLFVFTEDKTFFDFNIMQTGAYINDGILMNVLNDITGLEEIYTYQLFEVLTMFAGGIAIYAFFADRIKTKRGLVGTLMLFFLYMYGYPYNSWIYGFSYLSVGITLTALILVIVEMLFSEEEISKKVIIPMIIMSAMGIIFSYCLFVPAVFASICIYVFLKELLDKNSKKYFKIFGKYTLIITASLLVITAFGIGYLFIPSFIIEGQTDLISALQEDGGIYKEKYRNFIAYIPFAIIFVVELFKRIKNKNIRFLDIFSCIMAGYLILFYAGMLLGKVSPYYMLKLYFVIWIVIFAVTIDILNNDINKKMFRADIILWVLLFGFLVVQLVVPNVGKLDFSQGVWQYISIDIFKFYLIIILVFYTCLPEILKNIDFSQVKFLPEKLRKNIKLEKIKVSPFVYVLAVFCFISGWTVLKADNILGEAQKHALPNLVGMYYDEDCEYRKARDVVSNFNANNILVTKYARENLKDMTADNTLLMTKDVYWQIWGIATLEYTSDNLNFRQVLKTTNKYNLKDALENENIKYIVRLDSRDLDRMEACREDIKQLEETENAEVLYSNENGFVAKIR